MARPSGLAGSGTVRSDRLAVMTRCCSGVVGAGFESPARKEVVKEMAVVLSAASLLLVLSGPAPGAGGRIVFAENEVGRCAKCHGMPNFAVRDSVTGRVRDLHVDAASHTNSAHGGRSCRDCHADVTGYPHVFPAGRPRLSCGAECHAKDGRGRPYSHAKQTSEWAASAHGRGEAATNPDSPTCTTCHGGGSPHAVTVVKKQMTVPEKMALCAGCHDDRTLMARNEVDPLAVVSYRRSYHYKAIHFGATGTAVCQDCHTVHHVLPKDDAASTIATANLPRTCGQEKCHPGAAMNFAMSGANHLALRIHREPLLLFEERFFRLLTGGTMLALVAGIILDVQRRLGWGPLVVALARALRAAGVRALAPLRGALVVARRLLVD